MSHPHLRTRLSLFSCVAASGAAQMGLSAVAAVLVALTLGAVIL